MPPGSDPPRSGSHPPAPEGTPDPDEYVRRLQRELQEGRANLRERVKELNCLFTIDRELRRADGEWIQALEGVAEALPPGFQFPDRMGARLEVNGHTVTTARFRSGGPSLIRSVDVGGEEAARIQVTFIDDPPSDAPGDPFLAEEERLMDAVADRIREALRRRRVEGRLRRAEAFQRALIDASPVGLFSLGPEGRILRWNPAAERIFGWPAGDVLGDPLPFVDEEDETDPFHRTRTRVLEGEAVSDLRRSCRRRDGETVEVSLSLAPVFRTEEDGSGGVHLIMGVVEDITAQARATRKLRLQARLLEAVGQAVVATDLDGRITYWNRAAEELYGWPRDEVHGRPVVDLTVADGQEDRAREMVRSLQRGEGWSGELALVRRDGSTFTGLVTNSPILEEDGTRSGMIGVSSDVSPVKELEQRLHHSQKMEAVGRLAGGVAHDFNNLLTVIQGHSHMVWEDLPSDSPLREGMDAVLNETHRAVRLTRQLLTFSRRQLMQERVVDLRQIVANMMTMLRRLIPSRIETSFEAADEPRVVRADPVQIEQVILNLVVNASDAVEGPGRITLRVDEEEVGAGSPEAQGRGVRPGRYARITVADTGVGMTREVMERIFEPFFSTKAEGEGTGLGLSTAYGVVSQSGGYLTVESEPGAGSTFQVLLPLVEGEVAENWVQEPEPSRAFTVLPEESPAPHQTGVVGRQGPPVTILLVDDTPAVREVAEQALSKAGHTVLTASDGEEALELLVGARREVDLVVTDVVMPGMGGAELMDRLAELRAELPIMVVSGHSDREFSQDLRGRAAAFLTKPFTPGELLLHVERALGR